MAGSASDGGADALEGERPRATRRDGNTEDLTMTGPQRPTRPPQAREPQKISKCAFCRKDHKKCVRPSEEVKCERCQKLNYSCFGALETALSSSPRRALSRKKCQDCREAKQKCLPVDRVWPNICERCSSRNLPCSEPGGTRNRPRRDIQQMMPPSPTNQETNQGTSLIDSSSRQTRSIIDENSVETTTIGISDDASLSILSHAAAILQTDNIFPTTFQETDANYDHIITQLKSKWARGRWNRIIKTVVRENRINKIAAEFLYAPQPDSIGLCKICIKLGLSRDNFTVQKHDDTRFKRKPVRLQDRLWLGVKREGADYPLEEVELGNARTILKRGYICAFCRLVWKSAQDQVLSSRHTELNTMVAYATWQIDGRQILASGSRKTFTTKPQNRRIRIHWRKGRVDFYYHRGVSLNDAFVLPLADEERRDSFLGRRIETGKSITTLVKGWVEHCRRHHTHNDKITPEELFDWADAVGHNFKLIDVEQMRTVSYTEEGLPQYVALSYSSGTNHPLHFRKDQIEEFERLGSKVGVEKIWSNIPRTIQDAIVLVKTLGFRFLWVDVLCSIYEDLRLDHRDRAQIFSKAVLTICAADGISPKAGLVALDPLKKSPIQHIGKCGPGLELVVSHPAETYLNFNPCSWNKLGWKFQERILSTRCLIFVAGRVYWQCRDATASTDIVDDSRELSWSVDMLYNPLHMIGDLNDGTRAIRAYMRCVEEYTPRQIQLPDDILLAFQSVGQVIGRSLKTELLYGLPSSFMDLALLWEFKEAPSKIQPRLSHIGGLPSWSWCGWEGPITYRTSTLSGILSNVSGWISKHTWISWYVRDQYNIPRLLHKSGQEPITASKRLDNTLTTLKTEPLGPREATIHSQQQQQTPHHVKWPAQNRSMFFKSVPNLSFDMMDLDREDSDDVELERRDTKYLQFWTWSAFFRLHPKPLPSSSNLGPGISRFGILDDNDDFCGTIVLPDQYVGTAVQQSVYELVAISEAKELGNDEFEGWTYYIPKEKEESEWDLWYVLLVEKIDDVVVKRVGLGKVFQEAFENSCAPGKEWREFIMA